MNKVRLVEGKTKKFHYAVVGSNGEVRSHSEQYSNKSNARRAAKKAAKDMNMEYEDIKPKKEPNALFADWSRPI